MFSFILEFFSNLLSIRVSDTALQISKEAFDFTKDNISVSSTRFTSKELDSPQGKELIRQITLMRKQLKDTTEYTLDYIHSVAKLALKYKVGNCFEKTCVVAWYIHTEATKKNTPITFEIFRQFHQFIIHHF